MLGRTLRPRSPAQQLHVDFPRDMYGWPMVGFIFMMDEFRRDNGATLFAPGSHESQASAADEAPERLTVACGPAGSVIVYNGSVWHGHGTNETGEPRRSIQGAYIRREEKSGIDLRSRMRPETLERISALGKYLLAV
jgi:ectoine hydroxylase-related dioxygenase (phytanoyl-CoA dioxygenase family)